MNTADFFTMGTDTILINKGYKLHYNGITRIDIKFLTRDVKKAPDYRVLYRYGLMTSL